VEIAAVVVRERDGPARVEQLSLAGPAAGEVLVRVLASGVCHSDLHYQAGALGDDFPYLLGHEGAGVVEAVGPGVRAPAEGDYVALTYRAPCGECRFCRSGLPHRCVHPAAATTQPSDGTGTTLTRALDLGTHATQVVVAAAQAIPIPRECPPEVACLLGCGVCTGVGAVLHTAGVRPASSVAVLGIGGVGANVILGARLARASMIIAVDVAEQKLKWAKTLGATHTINAAGPGVAARIRELTGGDGVSYAFDAVGLPATLSQCIESLEYRGTAVLIGLPAAGTTLSLPLLPYFFTGSSLRVCLGGDILPSRDLPLLARWYCSGELPLDGLVSRCIGLAEIEDAFTAMLSGEVLRSVVRMPGDWPARPLGR
jgi:S-(hydroxymethyl)mycothiol dehydrogenase